MPVSPPKALAPKNNLPEDPVSQSLEQEILAEKAATYSRLVQKLEKALEALRAYESAHNIPSLTASPGPADPGLREGGLTGKSLSSGLPEASPGGAFALDSLRSESEQSGTGEDAEHEALLNAAGRALWYVMIQRDLCGFRRHDLFYKELKVPMSVRLRMGIARSR